MKQGHEYFVSPRLLVAGGAMAVVLVLGLQFLASGYGVLLIVVPIATVIGVRNALKLTIGPDGITVARRSAPWEDLEFVELRNGWVIRTSPDTYGRSTRINVALSNYDRDWVDGAIGDDLERWAPHFFLDQPETTDEVESD